MKKEKNNHILLFFLLKIAEYFVSVSNLNYESVEVFPLVLSFNDITQQHLEDKSVSLSDKDKKWSVCSVKLQITNTIHTDWFGSLLLSHWETHDLFFVQGGNDGSDQTGRVPRLT